MENREIAIILLNMQLDMDYEDTKQYGKMTIDILEEECNDFGRRNREEIKNRNVIIN